MFITKYQLFCLIMLFEIGSSTLFALGISAKQDAWIAIILALLIAYVLLAIYIKLQNKFPKKNFIEILILVLGSPIGIALSILYGAFFIYCSSRNMHDFGLLMQMTFLNKTPVIVIHGILMVTSLYIIFLGLKVLARTSEIMFPTVIFFITLSFILVLASAKVDFKELSPILSNGIKPILNTVFPDLVNFPFGEVFVFSMYWCYMNKDINKYKISAIALTFAGMLIMLSTIITISALGVGYTSIATIPLLDMIKMINIGNFLTNLDALGVTIIFIGGFYKMLIFFYGAVLSFSTIFKMKNIKTITIICGAFVVLYSSKFEPSYAYHIWLGHKISLPYLFNTYQVILPPLILIIYYLKNKAGKISQSDV
ncbi:GerAB/ArcD/ProY family transporter [Clostridium oryzae]|uniref:Spore germination protein YndE n=1 Tax=Clostridium oryzae TaxID=1450648 RepID=A0A1V4II28_9CLOT|nr:GerAB/ArcD/ProY family transporter [Clostridium oryzae]OPJ59661.1 spore germination protein YndE [Clostridium oryzae]